ncbi:hypothetical protein Bca4012_023584 [Brassica carinata]
MTWISNLPSIKSSQLTRIAHRYHLSNHLTESRPDPEGFLSPPPQLSPDPTLNIFITSELQFRFDSLSSKAPI